jgi:bacterioferritin (cytochrome b1)
MFTEKCTQCGKRFWFKDAKNRADQCAKDNILAGPIGELTHEIAHQQQKMHESIQRKMTETDPIIRDHIDIYVKTREENIKKLEERLAEVRKLGE